MKLTQSIFDVVVVGGGPSGATAATDLATRGHSVLLLDSAGRIKPCGGAIPPRLIRDFDIPEEILVARVTSARVISPKHRYVDMPIGGFVGMVDRESFDEWLRERAAAAGAERMTGLFKHLERDNGGVLNVGLLDRHNQHRTIRARFVIGADGANSAIARQDIVRAGQPPFVFAYHEIVRAPKRNSYSFDAERCDVYYNGELSPDFYGWIFPHGDTISVGTGSARKGFSLRRAVTSLRQTTGLGEFETVRREGAPIPIRPLKRWDNGRDVLLAGDAAGVVAPASGEGIYYAMVGGRIAAEAVDECLITGRCIALGSARTRFMKSHGQVFRVLAMMQHFWYSNDNRRERFVHICRDKDVQRLTWNSYMNKEMERANPVTQARIFFKNIAHLTGLVPV